MKMRKDIRWVPVFLLLDVVFLSLIPCTLCVDGDSYSQTGNAKMLPLVTDLIYGRLSNLSVVLRDDIVDNLGYCVKNVKQDWNGAFNFAGKLDFLSNCIKQTKGDLTERLCTAAELKLYFNSFVQREGALVSHVKPNKNCNLTDWLAGCEPGWSCNSNDKIDLKNAKEIPLRTDDCNICCEGFFCPQGLTCMIPCPLGAYCPVATLNKTTGTCQPYNYQIPPGQPNHTCGSADSWGDIMTSGDMFCSPGSFCPSTTREVGCTSGHFCRTGSTSQMPCFQLTTCNANTSSQNIHAYGVLLIVGLTFLMIVIYNCSDQVLSTRERRQAKSREAAARHARETAQARERWKLARDVAKKPKMGLQQQLSRTFSRKKSIKQPDALNDKPVTDLPPLPPNSSDAPGDASGKESGAMTKMTQDLDHNLASNEGFNIEIVDKNIKKQQPPKGNKLHSHSKIYKYAYGQIEKEKAMQQNNKSLTFSGVISMATDTDIRTRPVIEIAFKDLTLTLKGKQKHLLRCVSGKFMPGRVSAVMGPSGAGKTTFLSALAGKATGCTKTEGVILINGKNESIHSYKKIIGFVPQDDIVHGNLTVEENLRFSARCRLSADLPKHDKVLVIERVIECLGLQAIRDSLVGTVERRGISGGQKKRVNVGLEMVMEPSLLILDEPTSGLDSASSNLLLRALRREALEGVNISMVVHQPSYTLYKMFDDLILLAKGGLTAYHGPVKKVEEYFSGIGIPVPERVNPPDHYIDILEGIVKPSGDVTSEQLPVRWMLHNGYTVPFDMLQICDTIATSSTTASANNAPTPSEGDTEGDTEGDAEVVTEQSFGAALWEDVKCNVQVKGDHIQHNFNSSKDLSNRRVPGVLRQYRYFFGRVGKQRLREARIEVLDYMILLVAGACLGTLAKVSDETIDSYGYTYTVIAVSLLCKIGALRSFSQDKLHYFRESAAGISSLAYFLSKDTLDLFNIFVKPLIYLSMFYFFNNPRSSFGDNYVILLCLVYCVTGIAYIFAILLEPSPAQLWSVLLPVVLTLVAIQDKDSKIGSLLGNLCYTKWALEAFVIANAEQYSGVWLITRCNSLTQSGYDLGAWHICLIVLILIGIISRFIAFFCLVTFIKK